MTHTHFDSYLHMGDIQVAYYDLNQETFEFDLDLNQDRDFVVTLIEYPTENSLKFFIEIFWTPKLANLRK